jgi:tRNA U38,U39,U40 pseudouridine synthase TruA
VKITIESTDKLTHIDGVPVRIWEGRTEHGVPCTVMVHRIAVRKEQDTRQFEAELKEKLPPGRQVSLSDAL